MQLIWIIVSFVTCNICTAAILYDPNYLNYNSNDNRKKCLTTCYSPETGFTREITYGDVGYSARDTPVNYNTQDHGNRIINLGSYTSQSRCKYQRDVIIDDGVARIASTSEKLKIDRYRREMRDYNSRQYGSFLVKGFTQLYGAGLPFRSESSSAPKPPCFCTYCRVVVVEDEY